ncbi:MAG: c-type cytochrome, partial [Planctomycetales bacterium]|nr:c-type cytochrome [Planctomycetales bacterium]NIM09956.1 c-type cytochrome [Planctomycetales bacterium]NIN09396.1 c-type cytochrome [Planctomycetales bacterium]NIN78503.1 c-type cytochrome [Planctomycetales bacterium]NIO35695.1 c-type cytochrome [Planctomycetales bacterium]
MSWVLFSLTALMAGTTWLPSVYADEAEWIWAPVKTSADKAAGLSFFRRKLNLRGAESGEIWIRCDQQYLLYVNGVKIGSGKDWSQQDFYDISPYLLNGTNVIAVEGLKSEPGPAGLAASVLIKDQSGSTSSYSTNNAWRTSVRRQMGWQQRGFRDARWQAARSLGKLGATPPWGEVAGGKSKSKRARFEVMREFRVEWVVKGKDTGSLLAISFDEFGNILASRENGPLLLVLDSNKDKIADDVTVYCDQLKNCQGILGMNGEVYATADGPEGAALYRLRDTDRDGVADKVAAIVKFKGRMQEHGPHGLRLGPDGLIYMVCGNQTQLATPPLEASPHRYVYEGDLVQPRYEDPRGHARNIKAPGGIILRVAPDGSVLERFAGGLRNPYDIAFDGHGELLTWDADMEWDQGTSWYRPTRIHQVTAGAEFGWRSGWAKWPSHYIDSLPAVLETGNGSPTGLAFYDHVMYPARYHGMLFMGDWARGQIMAVQLARNGAGYKGTAKVFLEGHPLNVTDLEVGPDGWLYLCTGGRGTEGGIYRVTWTGSVPRQVQDLGQGIEVALRQPQLDSAYARQRIAVVKQKLGAGWEQQLTKIARQTEAPVKRRTRALQLMQLFGPAPPEDLLRELLADRDANVRGMAVYLIGVRGAAEFADRLAKLLEDPEPWVQRRACEALVRGGYPLPVDRLIPLLASNDRYVAWAAAKALQTVPVDRWQEKVLNSPYQRVVLAGSAAMLSAHPDTATCQAILQQMRTLMRGFVSDANFLDLLRICQLAVGRGELDEQEKAAFATQLSAEYPAGNAMINRELIRLLACLQASGIADRLLEQLEAGLETEDRIHLAVHAPHFVTGLSSPQRFKMLEHFVALREAVTSSNQAEYLDVAARDFVSRMSDSERVEVLAQAERWPQAALGAIARLPASLEEGQLQQLQALDQKLASREDQPAEKLRIGIAAVLARSQAPTAMAYLRKLYDQEPERRGVLAMGLAQVRDANNWPYLVRCLPIVEGNAAQEVIAALADMDLAPQSPRPVRDLILQGLKQNSDAGRRQILALLEKWTGHRMGGADDPPASRLAAWQDWFAEQYPDQPEAKLPGPSRDDRYTYQQLLHYLASDQGREGDAGHGAAVFRKADCAKCHRHGPQGKGIGPDLTTVASRLQEKEILQSIVYPSHVISDRYGTKVVET